ncbi:hypothetical protein FACS1894205_2280 [Alphaproteobacteria bacterium]|nr:hypothetical protein FACS1894205_2280 [Alphaproteobacteria bacterium]
MIQPPQQVKRRNSFLRELSEMVEETLVSQGVPESEAREASEELAYQLHRRWAGITLSFPDKDDLARARLKAHILSDFNGRNIDELCREYGVSERFVYKIIKANQTEKSSTQADLFA